MDTQPIEFKVRVVQNVGELSKRNFGKPGTILKVKGRTIESEEFYPRYKKYKVNFDSVINTIEELDNCMRKIHPEYYTIFEEFETKFKIKVIENIGNESEKAFGKPGTILEVTNFDIRSDEKNYLGYPKYGVELEILHSIKTVEGLNAYFKNICLETKFEEVRDFEKENKQIAQKIIGEFDLKQKYSTYFDIYENRDASKDSEVNKYVLSTDKPELHIQSLNVDDGLISSMVVVLESMKGWKADILLSWMEENE